MLTSLIIWIIIGLLAGWLAGKIVQGTGFGMMGDIAIGIVGALIAGWLFPAIGFSLGGGIIAAIIHATIGAMLLLLALRFVKQGGKILRLHSCIFASQFTQTAANAKQSRAFHRSAIVGGYTIPPSCAE